MIVSYQCFFLNLHPAAAQCPLKHIPGQNTVIASTAMITIGPSSTINVAWLFASAPPNPPDSSMTRYKDRMKMAIVDTASAVKDVSP